MHYLKPFLTIFLFIGITAAAQEYNPYQSIGKKGKILTASNGKFVEVFDYDSIQRIGSVLFNINTKKIVRLLKAPATFKKYSDNSSASRWWSPDPLSEKMTQWSPYNFAYNNPIRFNDPDGRVPGDFYDQQGNKIGTDGKNDGKVYVVTNNNQANMVKNYTAAASQGGTVQVSQVSSAVELPAASSREAMGQAVQRSNSPSTEANDPKGGMHEEGGMYGTDVHGSPTTINAAPGPVFKPGDPGVGVTPTNIDVAGQGAGTSNFNNVATAATTNVEGTFHVHPAGNGTTNFVMPPSSADMNNAVSRSQNLGITGNNYVLGAANNTVYVYKNVGGTGQVIATFPLDKFTTVK